MAFKLVLATQFKKDFKRIKKRGYDLKMLEQVLDKLCTGEQLDASNRDHALTGNYVGFRECHVKPDWLLIYAINGDELILTDSRAGTQSDLFDQ